jgi:hypothetical protein
MGPCLLRIDHGRRMRYPKFYTLLTKTASVFHAKDIGRPAGRSCGFLWIFQHRLDILWDMRPGSIAGQDYPVYLETPDNRLTIPNFYSVRRHRQ